jgi:hypothetical protein
MCRSVSDGIAPAQGPPHRIVPQLQHQVRGVSGVHPTIRVKDHLCFAGPGTAVPQGPHTVGTAGRGSAWTHIHTSSSTTETARSQPKLFPRHRASLCAPGRQQPWVSARASSLSHTNGSTRSEQGRGLEAQHAPQGLLVVAHCSSVVFEGFNNEKTFTCTGPRSRALPIVRRLP